MGFCFDSRDVDGRVSVRYYQNGEQSMKTPTEEQFCEWERKAGIYRDGGVQRSREIASMAFRAGREQVAKSDPVATTMEPARRALFLCAPHHQGGHSDAGRIIAETLGVSFPIRMPALVELLRREGEDPAEFYPWLQSLQTGVAHFAVNKATSENLSPAAQDVVDHWIAATTDGKSSMAAVAAVLCILAIQPYEVPANLRGNDYWLYRQGIEAERERNLAVASELESHGKPNDN